jgi:hypothetical protein
VLFVKKRIQVILKSLIFWVLYIVVINIVGSIIHSTLTCLSSRYLYNHININTIILYVLFYFNFLPYINSMRGFYCDNSIHVYRVLWVGSSSLTLLKIFILFFIIVVLGIYCDLKHRIFFPSVVIPHALKFL